MPVAVYKRRIFFYFKTKHLKSLLVLIYGLSLLIYIDSYYKKYGTLFCIVLKNI